MMGRQANHHRKEAQDLKLNEDESRIFQNPLQTCRIYHSGLLHKHKKVDKLKKVFKKFWTKINANSEPVKIITWRNG